MVVAPPLPMRSPTTLLLIAILSMAPGCLDEPLEEDPPADEALAASEAAATLPVCGVLPHVRTGALWSATGSALYLSLVTDMQEPDCIIAATWELRTADGQLMYRMPYRNIVISKQLWQTHVILSRGFVAQIPEGATTTACLFYLHSPGGSRCATAPF
jgi:hypothetical protein